MSLLGRRRNRRRPDRAEQLHSARAAAAGIGRVLIGLALIAGAIGGTWAGARAALRWATISRTFALDALDVSGNRRLSADEIRAASGLALGQNVFRADLGGRPLFSGRARWADFVLVRQLCRWHHRWHRHGGLLLRPVHVRLWRMRFDQRDA